MNSNVDISVVIGFRNWGQRRLLLAIKSIQESFGSINGEVIVSDYGSDDGQVTRDAIVASGARYIFTPTDGTWSRSRALNAGFAEAKGTILVSTDADMIFSPQSFEIIGKTLLDDSSLCLLLQCRDLPEAWSDKEVAEAGFDWDTFDSVSRLRPRWGMGGMMAVHRDVFARIRGLDERMHTYGGEDIDFATRAKHSGQRLLWVDNANVRMYHMWHQPTRAVVEVSKAAREAIEFNKSIVYNDKSFVRNTSVWTHRLQGAPPLVTVAIATHNRAKYLRESIISVLGQTLQDFEIVIVDDGSTDNTREMVANFNDPRIRYFYQERAGVAAARNKASDESRGQYTAVHDDDDLMTPWRLRVQLESLETGIHGSFGAFVNFDDATGEMKLYTAKALNAGTINESGGAPGHGTWLVETTILKRLRYDESLSSGVDNNLALRMVRSGFKFVHSGEILMLRRMHPGQITVSDEHTQKLAARQTRQLFSFGTTVSGSKKMKEERGPADWTKIRLADQLESLLPYLPDHLVERRLATPHLVNVADAPNNVLVSIEGEPAGALLPSNLLTSDQLAVLSASERDHDVVAELRLEKNCDKAPEAAEASAIAISQYLVQLAKTALVESDKNQSVAAVISGSTEHVKAGLDKGLIISASREFHHNGRTENFSVVIDPSGTEWPTWVASGKFRISHVIALRDIDVSIPVASTSDLGSNKA